MNSGLSLNIDCCNKDFNISSLSLECSPIKRYSPILDHSVEKSPVWKRSNVKNINNIYYILKSCYCFNNIEINDYIDSFKCHINKYVKILTDKQQYSKENIESYLKFYSFLDSNFTTYVKKIIINNDEFIV